MTVNALPAGVVGTPYSQTASAVMVDPNDGSYTVVWSGSGVAGLTINASTGAITGTPTAAGTYTVTCSVTDSNGTNVTDTGAVTVTATLLSAESAEADQVVLGSHYQAVTTPTETPKAEKKVKKTKGE